MDCFKIEALIEEDKKNKVNFLDLPTDIIQNNILSYLHKDKVISKIFHDQDDYYLQELLTGKIEKLTYVKPDEWNDYKTNLNLDCIKRYINANSDFFKSRGKIKKIDIRYRVTNKLVVSGIVVKAYDNKNYIFSANISHFIDNKKCNDTINLLKEEIKKFIDDYKFELF